MGDLAVLIERAVRGWLESDGEAQTMAAVIDRVIQRELENDFQAGRKLARLVEAARAVAAWENEGPHAKMEAVKRLRAVLDEIEKEKP